MGTSSSHGGPTDPQSLLPDGVIDPNPPPADGDSESADGEDNNEDTEEQEGQNPRRSSSASSWRQAKSNLTRALSQRGGGSDRFRRPARDYVRAQGGGKSAASSARGGRRATAALGGFLSSLSSGGFSKTVQRYGLQRFVGRPAEEMLAALVNLIAPSGSTREDAAARSAINNTLESIIEKSIENDGTLGHLEKLSSDQVKEALVSTISFYIYYRWLEDLGLRIEKKLISADKAVQLEREMLEFVKETLNLHLGEIDPLSVDWGTKGQEYIERVFEDAYFFLEQ